ncbi:PP2C-domain-containing protein [Fistulina hepatica ATCC 64428]|uniref:protein-serine/threonine phosphatase n=1 Tax=Fistulina hepatica ATCC 64428 TaxID=1128425 RepID=A0A0D7A3J7_9AGAR|nr:PP2C-domain-containing protein [Fistulina hepatica ATCC 64428]
MFVQACCCSEYSGFDGILMSGINAMSGYQKYKFGGQTLSSPATTKHTEQGEDARLHYAVTEMQGWRITMEDAHAIFLTLEEQAESPHSFFAIYDGHGGAGVAKFAGKHVHQRLVNENAYREQRWEEAMKRAFLGTDEDLLADYNHTRDPSGCTAVAALITNDNKIYVANAGDSRAVISVKGEAKPLSFDHKPSNETEKARISAAGGYIEYGRVNGNLALSRALGDFEFKKNTNMPAEKQVITADPDVTCHEISEEDEFLVLACDGIWDCLSSQQVMDFVRLEISIGKDLAKIGELICEHCLAPDTTSGAGIGCDNMTVLIIAILHGRTKEEWYSWVADRVKSKVGYSTPLSHPTLYAESRLKSFKMRREALEARNQLRLNDEDNFTSYGSMLSGGFARVLGSTGGISFRPGAGILSDSGTLMFGGSHDDSDDESDDEDLNGRFGFRSFFSTEGMGAPDPYAHLQSQLEEFEKDDASEDEQMIDAMNEHEGSTTHIEISDGRTTDTSPPLVNGTSREVSVAAAEPPSCSDALNPAVELDGLTNKIEHLNSA